MQQRPLVSGQFPEGRLQHAVGQPRIGMAAHVPGDHQAVKTVNDRGQVDFGIRSGQFGDIGQPFFVGVLSLEVAVELIGLGMAALLLLGISPSYPECCTRFTQFITVVAVPT